MHGSRTLAFAPFSIHEQGISNGREFILWPQVQAIDVKEGRLTIKKVGMSKDWGVAMVAKIPNYPVFIVVVKEMRQQAGSRR